MYLRRISYVYTYRPAEDLQNNNIITIRTPVIVPVDFNRARLIDYRSFVFYSHAQAHARVFIRKAVAPCEVTIYFICRAGELRRRCWESFSLKYYYVVVSSRARPAACNIRTMRFSKTHTRTHTRISSLNGFPFHTRRVLLLPTHHYNFFLVIPSTQLRIDYRT